MVGQNAHPIGKRATFGGLEVENVTIGTILLAFGVRHRYRLLRNTMAVCSSGKLAVHDVNANILWVQVIRSHPSVYVEARSEIEVPIAQSRDMES